MDNWNRTPNCSGWMGFSCAPVLAAEERCGYGQCLRKDSPQNVVPQNKLCLSIKVTFTKGLTVIL